ncbi:hypothetical protein GCM10022421_25030 [Oceanisphaera sediminis]|uniref:Uncharacterized protein n=1 Tax=Oceanisphaera sediminis TaxID=981381 RepID=A0ABP7EBZ4_9GAMM
MPGVRIMKQIWRLSSKDSRTASTADVLRGNRIPVSGARVATAGHDEQPDTTTGIQKNRRK